jgi:BolA protein
MGSAAIPEGAAVTTAPANTRAERLAERLQAALQPTDLEIIDDSHLHAGHAGARDGRGHFTVNVVAERFAGLPVVRRHKLVYEAVGDMMSTDIHALSIRALAPGENSST